MAMALVFYWFGHICSQFNVRRYQITSIAAVIVITAVMLDNKAGLSFYFDMKNSYYGIPFVSIALALSLILLTQETANFFCVFYPLKGIFSELGKGSMVIMYLHQAVQMTMRDYLSIDNSLVRIMAGIGVPYLFFELFARMSIPRKLLLGDYSD